MTNCRYAKEIGPESFSSAPLGPTSRIAPRLAALAQCQDQEQETSLKMKCMSSLAIQYDSSWFKDNMFLFDGFAQKSTDIVLQSCYKSDDPQPLMLYYFLDEATDHPDFSLPPSKTAN